MMRALAILFVLISASCVEPHVTPCAGGVVCPEHEVCSPRGGCVAPEQLAQCEQPPVDGSCTLPGGETGVCVDAVCIERGCGNGLIEADEACDDGNRLAGDGCSANCRSDERCGNGFLDTNLGEGCDCGDSAFAEPRPGGCDGPNSSDPDAACTEDCKIRGCGDGVVGGLEDCDGSDVPLTDCTQIGWYGGTLGCLPTCQYDVSACVGRCGDGTRNGSPVELCDPGDGGAPDLGGMTCQSFGYYFAGGLACNSLCGFDTSACMGACGDGVFDAGNEPCEPGVSLGGKDCTDLGFYNASGLACTPSCEFDTAGCSEKCGDGIVNGTEECDGGVPPGGPDCTAFGYYGTSGLGCRDNCTFDTSACTGGRCGDLMTNGPEECDGSVPPSFDCRNLGYYDIKPVTCSAACTFDRGQCTGRCGDLTTNGPEDCDGSVPPGLDCTDYGYYAPGSLACTNCAISTASCSGICGDGVVQSVEDCEPSVALAQDCTDFGFYAPGGLVCTSSCGFDDASCAERCGDDMVNGPEICDGAPPDAYGCAQAGGDAGQLGCADGCYETFDNCRSIGFDAESPGDVTISLQDVWGLGNELFAVGSGSNNTNMLHRANGTWQPMSSAVTSSIAAVWGAAADDVFTAGNASGGAYVIQHYNGAAWTRMTTPASGDDLKDIFGVGSSAVWAVGKVGTVLFYNGAWNKLTTPISASVQLNGVWASSTSDVFVVGFSGTIFHYNGIAWSDQSVAATNHFLKVWGRSSTDVYATTTAGTIWHYTGGSWTLHGSCGGSSYSLEGIGGMTNGAVVAVGRDPNTGSGVLCQLGADVWHRLDDGTLPSLAGVSGADLIVAVGDNAILASSGASWLPAIASSGMSTSGGIWGTSANNLFIVGKDSANHNQVSRWNGTTWTPTTFSTLFGVLVDVYGGATPSPWAVAVSSQGKILVSDGLGGAWTEQASGTSAALRGVWGDSAAAYIVGDGGTLLRRTTGSTTWDPPAASVTGANLSAVTGVPGGPVFAVGSGGTIVTYQGGAWSTMSSPVSSSLQSVWARSATDVFASGVGGTLLHYDGVSWTSIPTGRTIALTDVWGAAGDLFLLGGNQLFQYVGGRVLPVRPPVSPFFVQDAWGTRDATFFMAGNGTLPNEVNTLGGRMFQPAAAETVCDDFWDDDEDGLADCADPQCAAAPACVDPGACRPVVDLACGQTINGTTVGGATRWPFYGAGCQNVDETGREAYFRVERPTTGNIDLSLSGYTANLDLIVASRSASGACLPDEACLAASQGTSATEAVTVSAAANTSYIVIVDGRAGATSAFTLQALCP